MNVIRTKLEPVAVLEPARYTDERGRFTVNAAVSELSSLLGHPVRFAQMNTVDSIYGAARGLHVNVKGTQGKLVWCVVGEQWSVAVDARKDSPTAGQWFGQLLTAGDRKALWVPPGFAHGTVCLSPFGTLQYLSTEEYDPDNEKSLALDSDVGIDWPIPVSEMIANPRDLEVKTLEEFWRLT